MSTPVASCRLDYFNSFCLFFPLLPKHRPIIGDRESRPLSSGDWLLKCPLISSSPLLNARPRLIRTTGTVSLHVESGPSPVGVTIDLPVSFESSMITVSLSLRLPCSNITADKYARGETSWLFRAGLKVARCTRLDGFIVLDIVKRFTPTVDGFTNLRRHCGCRDLVSWPLPACVSRLLRF